MSLELTLLASFFYSVIAGLLIRYVVYLMWKIFILEKGGKVTPLHEWQAFTIGIIERSLYLISILIHKPEFIVVWLTLKTISLSNEWAKRRPIFNNFLAGSGLSILFTFANAVFIQWAMKSILEQKDTLIVFPTILENNTTLAWLSFSPFIFTILLIVFLNIVLMGKNSKPHKNSKPTASTPKAPNGHKPSS